jgi:hydrogenase 3 maturation protease
MSKLSWLGPLSQALKWDKRHGPIPRVAVVGMGHDLRGDDAAGLSVARALQEALTGNERVLVVDAGPAPENQTGPLRHFEPDLVLFVDAAQMDEEPGVIRWLSWEEVDGISASTHTLPLGVLARYLVNELGCEVALLGIQPASDAVEALFSPQVAKAVDSVVDALSKLLSQDRALGLEWEESFDYRKEVYGVQENLDCL